MKPKRAYTLCTVGDPLSKITKFPATKSLFGRTSGYQGLGMCFKDSAKAKFDYRAEMFGLNPNI